MGSAHQGLAEDVARIDEIIRSETADNPLVADLTRADPQDLELGASARWYVRMRSDVKTVITVWFTVKERSLHYETYLAPAPGENVAEAYEYALRVNRRLEDISVCIGGEDAFFLQGQRPVIGVEAVHVDRILGALYAASEELFPTLMRIGYATSFRG
jgi:hypothetical protein